MRLQRKCIKTINMDMSTTQYHRPVDMCGVEGKRRLCDRRETCLAEKLCDLIVNIHGTM